MTAILALDQGTTGSTALVVRRRRPGARPRIPRVHPVLPRARMGRARSARDCIQVSVEAMREAVAQAGTRPDGARHHQPAGDDRALGSHDARAGGRAIVWQDRRTTARCRELREAGLEPMIRAAPAWSAIRTSPATKLEWLLRDPALRRRADRGDIAAGTVESWLVARFTGGLARQRSHQRIAHASLRPRDARLGRRHSWHSSRCPARTASRDRAFRRRAR